MEASRQRRLEELSLKAANNGRHHLHKGRGITIDWSQLAITDDVIRQGSSSSTIKAMYYDQEVAVKVLKPPQKSPTKEHSVSLRKAFDQEVSLWSQLDHPNILKFVGASELNDIFGIRGSPQHYMVGEYLCGGTLKSYLTRNSKRKLPLKIFIQLALDLAKGLAYLHSEGILHRNLKSETIFLDDKLIKLKIADFGVACLQYLDSSELMTGTVGTLGYMAPEVMEGKPYNTKSDVYSYGICLSEIICCSVPFDPSKFSDLSTAISNMDIRPKIPKSCPNSLAELMSSCWSSEPSNRPEMKEVISSLESIYKAEEQDTVPPDKATCFCFLH